MPVRVATLDDIPAMHALRLAVRENVLSDPARVQPQHYRRMLEEDGAGWVYEEGGRITGFGIADHRRRNIWALFVAPGCEQRGIGRSLLAAMVSWLCERSGQTVWLSTMPGTRAERFYRAAGWRQTGVEPSGELRFELSCEAAAAAERTQPRDA